MAAAKGSSGLTWPSLGRQLGRFCCLVVSVGMALGAFYDWMLCWYPWLLWSLNLLLWRLALWQLAQKLLFVAPPDLDVSPEQHQTDYLLFGDQLSQVLEEPQSYYLLF